MPRQHVVAKKDTVYGISRRYGVPVRSVIEQNRLAPPYALRASASLILAGLADPQAAFIRLPLTPASVTLLTADGP